MTEPERATPETRQTRTALVAALALAAIVCSGARVPASEPVQTSTATCATAGISCNGATPEARDAARAAGRAWLDRLGADGLVVESDVLAAEYLSISGNTPDRHFLTVQEDGWYLNIIFSGPVDAQMTRDELQAAFSHIAIARMPTPELEVAHWEITPLTPTSSFSEGVEVAAVADGRLTLRVRPQFFALHGRDERVVVPADAPTPQEGYFQIREAFSGDLTLTIDLPD